FLQSYCRLLSLPSFPTRRSSDLSVPQRLLPPMLSTAKASLPRRSMMETKSYFILSDPSFLLPCGVFFKTDFHEPAYHIFSTISSIFPLSPARSEEHTSELQSRFDLVCRL